MATINGAIHAANDLWQTGDATKVADAFARSAPAMLAKRGAYRPVEQQFMADWILALSYADPAAALLQLDAWQRRDPASNFTGAEAMRRMALHTRILLRQGKSAEAEALVSEAAAKRDAAMAALAQDEKGRKAFEYAMTQLGPDGADLVGGDKPLRAAEFLVAAAKSGEPAFARFKGFGSNPFWDGRSAAYVHGRISVQCASTGLKSDDWMIVQVGYDRTLNQPMILPFAQSRDEMLKPFLEAFSGLALSIRGMRDVSERQYLLLRCANAVPPAKDVMPDYDYVRAKLEPLVPSTDRKYHFNYHVEPISKLVADKQWLRLANLAYQTQSLAPHVRSQAARALVTMLESQTPVDEAALAIARYWLVREAVPGDVRAASVRILEREAAVNNARTVKTLPPRVLSLMEFELASQHEIIAQRQQAAALYRAIVARAPAFVPEGSAEVIKAQLRLAALADAAGKKDDADAIFATLGLSPDQCSLYQPKPVITAFRTPDYPSAALREEMEGSVQFEFDLGKDGAPTNFRVTAASPPFVFEDKTISSFQKASFAPATRGGEALPCEAATQSFIWRMPDY